eukprot:2501618-Amphidinium_carterae.1
MCQRTINGSKVLEQQALKLGQLLGGVGVSKALCKSECTGMSGKGTRASEMRMFMAVLAKLASLGPY